MYSYNSEWKEAGGNESRYCLHLSSGFFDEFPQNTAVYGQFAQVMESTGGPVVGCRDSLGIGKKFYIRDQAKQPVFADKFTALLDTGEPVYALPRGRQVRITHTGIEAQATFLPSVAHKNALTDEVAGLLTREDYRGFSLRVGQRLERVFSLIKQAENAGFTVFVALSGGLDSSTMASFAQQYCASPIATTLDLGRSEDAEKATLIARELGIRHCVFSVTEAEILSALELAPELCQDFRDFNVHCAALNILLAKKISAWADAENIASDKRLIITGDLMNEYLCDYEEEIIQNTRYYRLPRINKKSLQQHLIGGLDTSDRELGPFRHFGLHCVQPYAVVHDLYDAVPETLLAKPHVKPLLNGGLVPDVVLHHIPQSKLRAQVGDKKSMGVLGLCHQRGITEADFKLQLVAGHAERAARIPIMMGRYAIEPFADR